MPLGEVEVQWVKCEPAWLLSGRTFLMRLAVCRVPTGQHREAWDRGTLKLRHEDRPSPAVRAVWERLAPPGIFQLCGGSQEAGPTACLGTAETRQQGLVAEPVVTTDCSALGCCLQSSVSKGESWSQSLGPLVREEEKASQVRLLGPALALLSGGPALSRRQDKGHTA